MSNRPFRAARLWAVSGTAGVMKRNEECGHLIVAFKHNHGGCAVIRTDGPGLVGGPSAERSSAGVAGSARPSLYSVVAGAFRVDLARIHTNRFQREVLTLPSGRMIISRFAFGEGGGNSEGSAETWEFAARSVIEVSESVGCVIYLPSLPFCNVMPRVTSS
jgi:hypothetical protein